MASVIVAGATGAIGRTVVQHAIRQPSIQRVVALTRSTNVSAANYEQLFGIITNVTAAEHAAAATAGPDGVHHETSKKKDKADTPDVVVVSQSEAAKIHAVTVDWEAFTDYWATANKGATTPANPDSATDPFNQYKEIFSGHTYAAMCLGTTRKDAGSGEKFVRCDYDYVIAFTEAVLAFSAPAGLHPNTSFMHHISDGGEVKKNCVADTEKSNNTAAAATAGAAGATATDAAQAGNTLIKTTGTLRVFSQISAGGADSDSMFLYMRTKGNADEAVVERVHQHNKACAVAGVLPPVLLFLLRPGLLQRHGKTRLNEKLAKLVVSAIPVETCGAAVVTAFVEPKISQSIRANAQLAPEEQAKLDAVSQEKSREGAKTILLGNPFTTTKQMKKAGVPSKEEFPYVYELTNSTIKEWAAHLPVEKDPVAVGPV